jgi:hypothetical protein
VHNELCDRRNDQVVDAARFKQGNGANGASFVGYRTKKLLEVFEPSCQRFASAARSLIEVVRLSVYLPRNARALMRARQLGGEIKYLSQGEIEARNRGYGPYSVETWRTWEYWANKAGCGHLLTRPNGERAHLPKG